MLQRTLLTSCWNIVAPARPCVPLFDAAAAAARRLLPSFSKKKANLLRADESKVVNMYRKVVLKELFHDLLTNLLKRYQNAVQNFPLSRALNR